MIRSFVVVSVLALFASACGGGDVLQAAVEDAASSTTTAAPATTVDTPTTEPDSESVTGISGVEQSVVKIFSEGTFIDSEVGLQPNAAGIGSGFIISSDGLVVTNNHVVAGAALLRVYLPGETKPINARILGVSECSDLAVIQLEDDGYAALEFREDEFAAGLSVYAAGYPVVDEATISDIDYTLTSGIVSALTANGESSWASVDEVIEHDARIRPGNSGGPLVDDDGRVVAINYAGIDSSDQNFAIAAADARPIIERLSAGEDVDSIGINGQAVFDSGSGLNGIWVASVASGSPADSAGIEPGDIIIALEGLQLALDGTMNDYCDILRTQGSDSTMSIEVLRYASDEFLEGQLNGDPLVQSFSFAQEFQDDVIDPGFGGDTYGEYMSISDDTDQIFVDVPVEWSDVDGTINDSFGPSVWASPDIDSFIESWGTPGIIVEVSTSRDGSDIESTLDEADWSAVCVDGGRESYEDVLYVGVTQLWTDCGGTGAIYIVLAVVPLDGESILIRVEIQAVEPRDLDAADAALASFFALMN